jgi:hypothetical protein
VAQPLHERRTPGTARVVGMPMDVLFCPAVVDLAEVRHRVQHLVETGRGGPLTQVRELFDGLDQCAVFSRHVVDAGNAIKNAGRDGLDLDMYQDEPVLVIQMYKVLDRVDISQRDRPCGIKSLPVYRAKPS